MRLRRSLLFVCGASPPALEAAGQSLADCLILDLEDTVTPPQKPRARGLVTEFLRRPARPGLERSVRVNAPSTPWFAEDVAAAAGAGAEALVVPKVESVEDIRAVEERLSRDERRTGRDEGSVKVLALIETPRGVLAAATIAEASPRVEALVIGHVDLSRSLGIKEAGAMEGTILHARCHLVLAAKAAGKEAIDAVFMNLDDPEGFAAEARQGLGFAGKLVIDERQVALAHEAYRPTEAEIASARRLVAAFEAAVAQGRGLFVFGGRAIDLPVVEAERSILARARAAAGPAREAKEQPPPG
jgi:citrate lyase subunit beta / citryl-CoA lyase